jgi:hypothetical protein
VIRVVIEEGFHGGKIIVLYPGPAMFLYVLQGNVPGQGILVSFNIRALSLSVKDLPLPGAQILSKEPSS